MGTGRALQALVIVGVEEIVVPEPGNAVGKKLTLTLADLADGRTEVALTDGDWASDDPHLPYCNTYWGATLQRLKSYVEKS